ncbi:MAG: hypothetical protein OJF59_001674 [Cytophagales bacterium]|jgi:hypothetical protein|nr:hypothetical protein [Bacteroidota bacterium]MBS1980599.1 hypothetical protein [Bacteroidota bacterium]WHZ07921.1 MAG: hypothetical protein OJF59_001674 [Cytophagales bacterium]
MIILENDYVICELDAALPVLKHRWKEPAPGEVFRKQLTEILNKYRELKKEYPKLAWLADTQLLGEVDEETEKWFAEEWDDMLFNQAKVKYHAVILGEDLFAEYPMEKFKMDAEMKFKEDGVQLGVFSDEEEAYDWIRTR